MNIQPLQELDLACPPMPQTLLRAVELTQGTEGPEPEQVVDMVQHDPAATARLLRVVNSAYHGLRTEIDDVERAVTVLGAAPVVGLVMSTSFAQMHAELDAELTPPFMNLVRHSIATAFLARHLIQRAPRILRDPALAARAGEAFTAGLLHDFGKLVLLYNYPGRAVAFYQEEIPSADAFLEMERERFGCDHVAAGVYFAERFRLPESLQHVLAAHHAYAENEGRNDAAVVLHAVAAANKAANAMDYAFNHATAWIDLGEDPAWASVVEANSLGYDGDDTMLATLSEADDDLAAYVGAVV